MNLKCFFGFHDYKYHSHKHYYDTSYRKPGAPSTYVVRKCSKCWKYNGDILYDAGFLEQKDVDRDYQDE